MSVELLRPTYRVRRLKHVLIPMSDGVKLAADIYLPEGEGRFPAVLEYLPYRKDDRTAARWAAHYYFAERGFASIRMDMRGTGGSGGVALNEYLPQEQADACEAIAWLAAQPWCNGNVGMWGTSYGGFNTLQVAMHNPPALKAIIPHAATDDRYQEDVHYFGGCLMGIDQVCYPQWMLAMNAMPPYQHYAGADWASIWQTHLDGTPPWVLDWLRHQTEDEYWLQGSLKVDYASIKAATLHLGAWRDLYVGSVFRMAEHLKAPNRAIVGPWQHSRPNDAYPEPRINHLHEMARWWAQWLRGEETGIMDEPQIALYVNHGAPPDPFLPTMPGAWRYEPRWPPERARDHTFYLGENGTLRAEPQAGDTSDQFRYQATVGLTGGFLCPLWPPYGMSRDQALDEARSLCYTTPPLEQPLELLGFAKAILHVASTATIAFFAVKISDVAPDGRSTLVTRGILNATHRTSHSRPEPLTPGQEYELAIPLRAASWVFQPGHRLRIAISGSDWPNVWPSPQPAVNTIFRNRARPSRIVLPIVDSDEQALPQPQFQPATALRPTAKTWPFIANGL
jgi:putative CocE/NonD family hydrolase